MKTIWIINQYAKGTSGRHAELALSFVRKGYRVALIISSFSHGSKAYLYDEKVKFLEQNGISLVYLHSGPVYVENGPKRIFNMLDFCRLLECNYRSLVKSVGAPDVILASSVHPFVWESGYRLSRKLHCKFVAEVRDIWPLSLVEVNHTSPNHPLVKLLSWVEKRAYKRSDAVVVSMPFAIDHVCAVSGIEKDKVFWIPNGIRTDDFDRELSGGEGVLPQALDDYLTKNWCAIYTGSFVPSENVQMLIRAMADLKDTDIHLAIVGQGQDESQYRGLIEELRLKNVQLFPFIAPNLVSIALSKAKCCVAAIHNYPIYRFGLSMNKLSGYLYSGKPVLFACDCPNVVSDAGHKVVSAEDVHSFASELRGIRDMSEGEIEQMAKDTPSYIRQNYDYDILALKYLNILDGDTINK